MNSFSRIFTAAALVAGALSLVPNAHAASITFGSYAGANTFGFADGTITSGSLVGTPVIASTIPYGTVLPGTTFVTYTNSFNAAAGTTAYYTTLTGNLAGDTGSISVLADDSLSVKLNGILIGSTTGPYDTLNVFNIPTADFLASGNTLEFDVLNTGGPTAFDFSGTAAATPEPSSLILLGSGLVSAAGMVIRKRRG